MRGLTAVGVATARRVGAVLGVTAVLGVGAPAALAAVPDSVELARLGPLLARAEAVRVTGAFGSHVLRDVRLDAGGLAAARWGPGTGGRPALIVGEGAGPAAPAPIGWDRITRIEVGSNRTIRGAALGGAVGGLLGALVWNEVPLGYDGARGQAALVIGVPALAGLVLGGVLGKDSYAWRTVHASEVGGAR